MSDPPNLREQCRRLGRGRAAQMTTTKPTSEVTVGNARSRAPAPRKTASLPTEKPVKAVPRPGPKPFGPRLVKDAPTASAPGVILWDDPVDRPPGDKPAS
jgi:hypothetical protein